MDLPAIVLADEMTKAAQWINEVFANFDHSILEMYHNLHTGALGGFFDFFFEKFTLLGEDGIFLLLMGVVLMLFKKTRKMGLCVVFGIGFGAVFTNLTIKEVVARPRPYMSSELYREWWMSVGHGLESEFSFPSGHTTASAAAMMAIFLNTKKKYISWLVVLFVIVMGASRNYLMVHFPSDIIGGFIVGSLAAVIAFILFSFLYNKVFPKNKLGRFVTDFDAIALVKKIKK